MPAEIWPVNAPSFSQKTSCAEMATMVFFAASTAAGIAVKGGATTMSQCVDLATRGAKAAKKARVSACVLNIFQLPAIARRRLAWLIVLPIVGEGFDAGEFAAAEKFERGAAAGRNVGNFTGNPRLLNRGDGISAANDGSGSSVGGGSDGFGNFQRALGEGRHLEDAHGAVPNDSFCRGDFLFVGLDGLRTDVQAHPAVR